MRIANIVSHLTDNIDLFYWSIPTDIKYPAIRLGDVYAENIVFIFDDVNHQVKIQRIVLRENEANYSLSDLTYSPGIIELSLVADLIYKVRNWLDENPNMDPALQYDSMQNSKLYIKENFDF